MNQPISAVSEPPAPAVRTAVWMPVAFVLMWSTGFLATKAGAVHASGTSYLLWRFAIAAAILTLIALASRAPWPRKPREWGHLIVAGILIHALYLAPNFHAASVGFPVGITALIGALQPLLTALLVSYFLGERVTRRQWLGLALGLAGIVMVLDDKIAFDWSRPVELAMVCGGLISLTIGTLYQRRYCGFQDLRSGTAVQLIAASVVTGLIVLFFAPYRVNWAPALIAGITWLVVMSLVLYALMHLLFMRGAAARVASLFYLVPPLTSLQLWLVFDERLGPFAIAGMFVTIAGVALAAKK